MTDTYETVPDTGSDEPDVNEISDPWTSALKLATDLIESDEEIDKAKMRDQLSERITTAGRSAITWDEEIDIDADELAESLNGGDES